jgi:hypothetical protein
MRIKFVFWRVWNEKLQSVPVALLFMSVCLLFSFQSKYARSGGLDVGELYYNLWKQIFTKIR